MQSDNCHGVTRAARRETGKGGSVFWFSGKAIPQTARILFTFSVHVELILQVLILVHRTFIVCMCVFVCIFFFPWLLLWEPEREERRIQWWETWLRRAWTIGMVSPLKDWARLHVASHLTCYWKNPVSAGF